MPRSSRPDDLRQLQLIWAALSGTVGAMALAAGALVLASEQEVEAGFAAALFYASAAAGIAALLAAFWVQRRLLDRLPSHASHSEAMADIRSSGVVSMAIMEGAALVAVVAAFLSAQLIPLLFLVPFFGFAAFFFPTEARLEALLRQAGRGGPPEG